jgi:hypothetical protein
MRKLEILVLIARKRISESPCWILTIEKVVSTKARKTIARSNSFRRLIAKRCLSFMVSLHQQGWWDSSGEEPPASAGEI